MVFKRETIALEMEGGSAEKKTPDLCEAGVSLQLSSQHQTKQHQARITASFFC
jgi:hypothetical protein